MKIKVCGKKGKQVQAGENFSMVLCQDNKLFVFGKGSYGRLGLPDVGTGKLLIIYDFFNDFFWIFR